MVKLMCRYLFLQYIYVKFGITVYKANIENINKAISNFNWTRAFENISVDKKVELLNEKLLNFY